MTVNNKQGFTLIELLIVVVIIGILAAIAIPKFSATREKAYVASMKADLRNLATAEDLYYSNDNDNSGSVDYEYIAVTASPGAVSTGITDYAASDGVTVTATATADLQGWEAVASHAATQATCSVFYGTAIGQATVNSDGTAGPTPAQPGQIVCGSTS